MTSIGTTDHEISLTSYANTSAITLRCSGCDWSKILGSEVTPLEIDEAQSEHYSDVVRKGQWLFTMLYGEPIGKHFTEIDPQDVQSFIDVANAIDFDSLNLEADFDDLNQEASNG